MSFDTQKIVDNIDSALESGKGKVPKLDICNGDHAVHYKKLAGELAQMVIDMTCGNPREPYTIRAMGILAEIESENA